MTTTLPKAPPLPALTRACAECPWRQTNFGKRHPHGWFSKANLCRLWNGIRTGNAPGMNCHKTVPDSDMERPEGVAGPPEGTPQLECAGALLVVQRELRIVHGLIERDPGHWLANYTKKRRGGLTKWGIAFWLVQRGSQFAGTVLGASGMVTIEEDPDVACPFIKETPTSVGTK